MTQRGDAVGSRPVAVRFGTDGMRGDARTEIGVALVTALATAAAEILGGDGFAVGRDPRESSPELAAAVHAGVAAAGGSSEDLGLVTTPAVAVWCRSRGVAGAMVTASHNPWHDNGVKLFGAQGHKPGPDLQDRIQQRFAELWAESQRAGSPAPGTLQATATEPGATAATAGSVVAPQGTPSADGPGEAPRSLAEVPGGMGSASEPLTGASAGLGVWQAVSAADRHDEALESYLSAVTSAVAPDALAGLRIVVDAANGAASEAGPQALRRLGAGVTVIHASPNGRNINAGCGSTDTESLQAAVTEVAADAGVAFDGDADRVLAVDHSGALVDGDQIMAICALDAHSRGELAGGAVVVTQMTNLGFHRGMAAAGVEVVTVEVGDRHVLAALRERGLTLGGEQSGHVIFSDLAPGGDGVLTAVILLGIVARSGLRLAEIAAECMTRMPQVLVNAGLPDRPADRPADLDARLQPLVAAAEQRLGGRGRVLVRASGTEPVVRVMVEADTHAEAAMEAEALAAAVPGLLG